MISGLAFLDTSTTPEADDRPGDEMVASFADKQGRILFLCRGFCDGFNDGFLCHMFRGFRRCAGFKVNAFLVKGETDESGRIEDLRLLIL
jgi:hypothetical protein